MLVLCLHDDQLKFCRNTVERTIEGDLFSAFVHAGAISKANANDPKKSGLVRCARTDKGVHAAGNVVSLKLIVEDKDIVEKINYHLSEQIRVWGIQRTVGSFSCYQACDSRWYEYLIPSHAFLPPHPNSYLGKKLVDVAKEMGELEAYKARQEEVSGFWKATEEEYIKPIFDEIKDETLKELVLKALYETEENHDVHEDPPGSPTQDDESVVGIASKAAESTEAGSTEQPSLSTAKPSEEHSASATVATSSIDGKRDKIPANPTTANDNTSTTTSTPPTTNELPIPTPRNPTDPPSARLPRNMRRDLESTTRSLRTAYTTAKRTHRIPPTRLARIRACLAQFLGTQNFHNYTINKSPRDPSAKRLIKSFTLDPSPKIINGTEWLSLKVHGQSFMMHQIRKMVSAVALTVRCGAPPSRIGETLSAEASVSIPKAPGLGLLLERPVFESYNSNTAAKFEREALDFKKYEVEMEAFKQREIYERVFTEEEASGQFGVFFGHVDGFREGYFMWVTAKGVAAGAGGSGVVSWAAGHTGVDARHVGRGGEKRKRDEVEEEKAMRGEKRKKAKDVDSEDEMDEGEKGRADMDG